MFDIIVDSPCTFVVKQLYVGERDELKSSAGTRAPPAGCGAFGTCKPRSPWEERRRRGGGRGGGRACVAWPVPVAGCGVVGVRTSAGHVPQCGCCVLLQSGWLRGGMISSCTCSRSSPPRVRDAGAQCCRSGPRTSITSWTCGRTWRCGSRPSTSIASPASLPSPPSLGPPKTHTHHHLLLPPRLSKPLSRQHERGLTSHCSNTAPCAAATAESHQRERGYCGGHLERCPPRRNGSPGHERRHHSSRGQRPSRVDYDGKAHPRAPR